MSCMTCNVKESSEPEVAAQQLCSQQLQPVSSQQEMTWDDNQANFLSLNIFAATVMAVISSSTDWIKINSHCSFCSKQLDKNWEGCLVKLCLTAFTCYPSTETKESLNEGIKKRLPFRRKVSQQKQHTGLEKWALTERSRELWKALNVLCCCFYKAADSPFCFWSAALHSGSFREINQQRASVHHRAETWPRWDGRDLLFPLGEATFLPSYKTT